MKVRQVLAGVAVATIALAGCSSDKKDSGAKPNTSASAETGTITVWYMDGSLSDAQVASLKSDFESAHTGSTANFQKQTWNGIGEKLTTALSSNDSPDVVELGNTQVAQYASVGALADVTEASKSFDNANNWLPGLLKPGQLDGKTYGIPMYAGVRTVVYRTDMFAAAGITKPPTSWDEFLALGDKLKVKYGKDPKFMPLYLPGQEWYTLASLIWDEGGDLATDNAGTWKGALSSPEAQAGIARYKQMFDALSKAPADTDEATPQQSEVMAQGKVAMMIGLAWEKGGAEAANKTLAGKLGVFALPSKKAGQPAPPFVGGSDMALAAKSKHPALATDFLKLVASSKFQTEMAKGGAIPNSNALAGAAAGNAVLETQIAAAAVGAATPVAPTWANVETTPNPIKDMLTKVLTGTSPAAAAAAADKIITDRMAG